MSERRASRSAGHILIGAAAMVAFLTAGLVAASPLGADQATSPWTAHLTAVDRALARGDVRAAERAWHEAYHTALGNWRWEGMLEVGDASLRIGAVTGSRKVTDAKARQGYLSAFFRARDEGSLEGMLRTAEAFARLGDREVADRCLRSAERLATTRDAEARDRVRELASRLASGLLEPRSAEARSF